MKQTATGIVWAQITGKPKTLAGYGISDKVVLTTGSYSDPSWIFSLEWNKITNAPEFEPALGNPLVDGYILSSTTAGLRSWIAPSGGTGSAGAGIIGEVPSGVINGRTCCSLSADHSIPIRSSFISTACVNEKPLTSWSHLPLNFS